MKCEFEIWNMENIKHEMWIINEWESKKYEKVKSEIWILY